MMREHLRGKHAAILMGEGRFCHVAAAVMGGSAVLGAITSSDASDQAAQSAANATAASSQAAANQNAIAQQQQSIANDQWARYKTTYAPMEDTMAADAQNYATPEKYAAAAGEANATTTDQFNLAKQRLARTPGLDQSSAAYATNLANMDTSQAAAGAMAQNKARTGLRDAAWARQVDALSLGKGLSANATTGLAQASSGYASTASQAAAAANAATAQGNVAYTRASNTAAGLGGMGRDLLNAPGVKNAISGFGSSPVVQNAPTQYAGSVADSTGFDGYTYDATGFGS